MEFHFHQLITFFLNNRTQGIKVNDCFSLRHEIEYGVPQGSILGPLLFKIDLIDLFFICENDDMLVMLITQQPTQHFYCNFLTTFNLTEIL